MGASASLVQLPHDLLNESKAGRGLLSRQNSRLTPAHLSTEVLANLRRKSDDGTRNPHTTPTYEIPPHVINLLEKISVDPFRDGQGGPPTTTKMVTHIFECLEGLQHLVRAEQGQLTDDFADHYSDSHSATEANKESVGRLLHEMVTIYTLCGDTLGVLLQSNPDAARIEDNFGRLPIHVAVDRDQPWCDAVERLLVAFPEGLNLRDSGGRLPLHIAVDRQVPNMEVVNLLLRNNPHAALARRGVGRLPLHYAIFADSPSLELIEALLAAAPECAQVTDVYGRLALHYAVDKPTPNVAVVDCLLAAFPGGAAVRDSHQRLPLTIAVERERIDLRIVKHLYTAYPEALALRCGAGQKTPLQVLVEGNRTNLLVVDFIARHHVDAICSTSHPNKRDSPMLIAIDRDLRHISRRFLLLCPTFDPPLLRQLNWQARKIAFLLAKGQIFRPSVLRRLAQMAMGSSPKVLGEASSSPAESARHSHILNGTTSMSVSDVNAHALPRRRSNSNSGSNPSSTANIISMLAARHSPVSHEHKSLRYPTSDRLSSPRSSPRKSISCIRENLSHTDIPASYWDESAEVHNTNYDSPVNATPSSHKVKFNFFLRLYRQNSDAFRLAVTFL